MSYIESFWESFWKTYLNEEVLPKVHSPRVQNLLRNKQFLARLKRPVRQDSSHDIPYLSGYSKDGKTVFFDRHFQPFMTYKGKTIDTRQFIMLHEIGEKALLVLFHFKYQAAHHIITHLEAEKVKAAGISWRFYSNFLKPQIKHIDHEKIKKVPKDLDLEPYRDEHDKRILKALVAGHDIRKIKHKATPPHKRHRH